MHASFCFVVLGLVLRFDGSLRSPKDRGFGTADLRRLASCSAVIESDVGRVLAIGGRDVSIFPGITSADVEFEGLLMGLRWLKEQASRDSSGFKGNIADLKIVGDCKVILDQLNNRSIPRKLRPLVDEAKRLIDAVGVTGLVSYIDVPRTDNHFPDRVSSLIHELVIENEMDRWYAGLQNITEYTDVDWTLKRTRKQGGKINSEISSLICRFFASDTSLIRHSSRPYLLRQAADKARSIGDWHALNVIGKLLESETIHWKSNTEDQVSREAMKVEALRLQMEGLHRLGENREVKKIEQKNRYLLRQSHLMEQLDDPDQIQKVSMVSYAQRDFETLSPELHKWRASARTQIASKDRNRRTAIWISLAE